MADDKTPHPVDVYVGRKLRDTRKTAGFSQGQLAEAIGVTFQQVQKYERGHNRISSSKLYEAAQFLKKDIGHFYPPVDDPAFLTDGRADVETAVAEIGAKTILALAGMPAEKRRIVTDVITGLVAA
ncbi:putative HTH domain DNA-binding protein [Caulobacter virus Karma]|uniref:Transcriptional regulator Cro/CI family n=6 Tax=Viruses TaxID=10239 RepID=K4JTG9_9CAUD|nr:putative HTH domain DNA-binding protein [Caulobacter phage phiCbK]YP_006988905.1 putative HTH domain DNA-binding protein [Caulobacter virus Magneto]YP_006989608.1 putative HTH domain DNA-binding protein [Caulobacter virus Karma]YP_006989956.1 putative HTH domain DNA-binding protein [Caulobacter phage CcrSwift]ARB13751.1 transcriptional regulator, Cro/CI family [Caulobacter phage Ccr10]ARB14096.1 transcriptional regulator, Cro/CI family [Caulobacter phage Ccr2]ARB14438.1 transcriptional reg